MGRAITVAVAGETKPLTQGDIAKRIHRSPSLISYLWKHERWPSKDTAAAMAREFHITIPEVFTLLGWDETNQCYLTVGLDAEDCPCRAEVSVPSFCEDRHLDG